jgi:Fe-S cluster assembly ATP-binding protein
MSALLTISNLIVRIDGKKILNGLSLEIRAGEVHAIMGAERFWQKHAF